MGDKCPECGIDLEGRDPIGHAYDHWPQEIPDKDLPADARARRQKLLAMAAARPAPRAPTPGPGE